MAIYSCVLSSLPLGTINPSMSVWMQEGGKFLTLKSLTSDAEPRTNGPHGSRTSTPNSWCKGGHSGCQRQSGHTPTHSLPHGHSPFHALTYPMCPQEKTELSVWGLEAGLHIINCNNWQVGHWLLAFNPLGAHEKNKKLWMLHSSYLAWAQRSFSLS